jgi:hypothetical protein
LLLFVFDFTVILNGPVTVPLLAVLRVVVPEIVSLFALVEKHDPSLKNENPVTSMGPVVLTEKATLKFSRLD